MRELDRVAVVGMGWIGGHLMPCYKKYLGDNIATHLMAFKRTNTNLDSLRSRYPFPILAGDYEQAFRRFQPTLIILSTIPSQIKPVAENLIMPYVQSLRSRHQPLPLILSFAPSPDVRYFTDVLGEDVDAFTVLPAMETQVNSVDCRVLSNTMLTPNPQHPPSADALYKATRFLEGLAQVLIVPQRDIMPILAGKITFHMLDLACQTIPGYSIGDSGQRIEMMGDVGQQYTAGRMRGLFMASRELPYSLVPCPDMRSNMVNFDVLLDIIQSIWYRAVMDFLAEKKAEGDHVQRIMDIALELHLLCLQMESRETILKKLQSHATPGGMSEHAVKAYRERVEGALHHLLASIHPISDGQAEDAAIKLRDSIIWLAEEIYQKGMALAG